MLTSLGLTFVSSPMASFSGVSVKIVVVPLVVLLLQPAPAKLVQLTPDPPTSQNMLVLTYQHNNWKIEAYSHAAK